MSKYELSDSASDSSTPTTSSSSDEEDELKPNLLYDSDFLGVVPFRRLSENTFLYEIGIDVNITSNKKEERFQEDCVQAILLVILGHIFHKYSSWKEIGSYLIHQLEKTLKTHKTNCWRTQRRSHYIYQGNAKIVGHCQPLKMKSTGVPVVYEDIDADFAMSTNGKSSSNRRVIYKASVFLSPALSAATNIYSFCGFGTKYLHHPSTEREKIFEKSVKLYLKNILRTQKKYKVPSYDSHLAWKTVFDAIKELREDPNYESAGNES